MGPPPVNSGQCLENITCDFADSTLSVEDRLTRRYQKLRELGKWGTSDGNA
jgi:hypothetical protein